MRSVSNAKTQFDLEETFNSGVMLTWTRTSIKTHADSCGDQRCVPKDARRAGSIQIASRSYGLQQVYRSSWLVAWTSPNE